MQFSQAQLRHTLGISVETFRHWKRVLPPFAARRRYTPRFSPGDLLAAAVLQQLTEVCGVRVGFLPAVSEALVDAFNAHAWAALDGKTLIVDFHKGTCEIVTSAGEPFGQAMMIVCPLAPIIDTLRTSLSRSRPTVPQHTLLRPPTSLDARLRRRRA